MSYEIRLATLAFTALAAVSACKSPDPNAAAALAATASAGLPKASADVQAPAAPQVDAEAERDSVLSEKLSHYIECINRTDSYVHESHQMLMGSLSPKHEVLPNRWPNLRATSVVRDQCYKGLDEAATMPPKLDDLEQAARAFRAAVDKLEGPLAEGDRYYHQGDDKDDKGAHGKQLVKQVLAGFDEFLVASKALRGSVEKYNDRVLANSLARVEKAEGRSLHFLCKKIVSEAKQAVDVFLDEHTDLAKLEAVLGSYQKLDSELRDRAEKFPQEKAHIENFFAFAAHGEFVLRDLKETVRAVKGKKPALADGSRESLLKSLNQTIEDSNKLEFKQG